MSSQRPNSPEAFLKPFGDKATAVFPDAFADNVDTKAVKKLYE